MPIAVLIIGALLVIVAFNNSMGDLVSALETDVPGFFVWAIAIVAICALGYVPGLRTPSRYLLALVLMVILLKNYLQIYAGFTAFSKSGGTATASGAGAANPTAAYTANPATTATPAAATVAGAGAGATSGATSGSAATSATQVASAASLIAANPLSPSSYLSALGTSGFGGIV